MPTHLAVETSSSVGNKSSSSSFSIIVGCSPITRERERGGGGGKERGRGREKERGRNLWRITLKSSLCSSLPNLQKQQQQTNKQDIQLFSQYINSAMRREVFFGNLFVLGFFVSFRFVLHMPENELPLVICNNTIRTLLFQWSHLGVRELGILLVYSTESPLAMWRILHFLLVFHMWSNWPC